MSSVNSSKYRSNNWGAQGVSELGEGNMRCTAEKGSSTVLNGSVAAAQTNSISSRHKMNGRKRSRSRHISSITEHSDSNSSSSSSLSSSSSSDDDFVAPPDGGWGWVVVFASFMVHLIADGVAFSFGVLYMELLDVFQESKGKTAWIGSLFVSVPLITGPVASALTNRYGCRATTMAGAVIAAFGFILSSFTNSVDMMCFTFGIVAGFGLSMVYVPAVVIVAYYFQKRRAFATGIAVAGSGIGTFVFAPIIEILIQTYSWRGGVLILGGVMLQMVVCGSLFRPLAPRNKKKNQLKPLPHKRKISEKSHASSRFSSHLSLSEHRTGMSETLGVQADNPLLFDSCQQQVASAGCHEEPTAVSLIQFPTYMKSDGLQLTPEYLEELRSNGIAFQKFLQSNSCILNSNSDVLVQQSPHISPMEDDSAACNNVSQGDQQLMNNTEICEGKELEVVLPVTQGLLAAQPKAMLVPSTSRFMKANQATLSVPLQQHHHHHHHQHPKFKQTRFADQCQPLFRKDIFYRGNLGRPRELSASRAASCPDVFVHTEEESSDDEDDDHMGRLRLLSPLKLSREVKHIMRKMLDISILRNVLFLYFCLSCMLLYMVYDIPYIFSVDKASNQLNIRDKKAAFLVSIIGITSTVGQVVIGYIGDLPRINSILLYNLLTSVAGIITMLVPLLHTYAGLAAYCGGFGFFISANYALTTIILVELLGMSKLTNAIGIVMLAQGVSNVIGPPLAGWMADVTGAYDLAFLVSGALMFLSGSMLFAIPCLRRCQTSVTQQRSVADRDSVSSTGQSDGEQSTSASQLPDSHTSCV